MIVYNVTVKIDLDVHDDWINWMQKNHIPEVLKTNLFTSYNMFRLLEQDEQDGITYAIQYVAENMSNYFEYQEKFAPTLQEEHSQKYKGKFVAFRTLMRKVDHSLK